MLTSSAQFSSHSKLLQNGASNYRQPVKKKTLFIVEIIKVQYNVMFIIHCSQLAKASPDEQWLHIYKRVNKQYITVLQTVHYRTNIGIQ